MPSAEAAMPAEARTVPVTAGTPFATAIFVAAVVIVSVVSVHFQYSPLH
jgi:hypothetical protein